MWGQKLRRDSVAACATRCGFAAQIEQKVARKNTNRCRAMVAVCVVLICAGCVFAQDGPQWRGPNWDAAAVNRT
jgi:hypothetical protein